MYTMYTEWIPEQQGFFFAGLIIFKLAAGPEGLNLFHRLNISTADPKVFVPICF